MPDYQDALRVVVRDLLTTDPHLFASIVAPLQKRIDDMEQELKTKVTVAWETQQHEHKNLRSQCQLLLDENRQLHKRIAALERDHQRKDEHHTQVQHELKTELQDLRLAVRTIRIRLDSVADWTHYPRPNFDHHRLATRDSGYGHPDGIHLRHFKKAIKTEPDAVKTERNAAIKAEPDTKPADRPHNQLDTKPLIKTEPSTQTSIKTEPPNKPVIKTEPSTKSHPIFLGTHQYIPPSDRRQTSRIQRASGVVTLSIPCPGRDDTRMLVDAGFPSEGTGQGVKRLVGGVKVEDDGAGDEKKKMDDDSEVQLLAVTRRRSDKVSPVVKVDGDEMEEMVEVVDGDDDDDKTIVNDGQDGGDEERGGRARKVARIS
ncbi:MAG: hypothetical protein M1817_003688 [Caeruleum heppii]|nr:MAG: hypothetical protein M1817_003688 [Caeruleum heppii]